MRLTSKTMQIAPPSRISLLAVFSLFFFSAFVLRPVILFLTHDSKHYQIFANLHELVVFASIFAFIFLVFLLVGYKTCRASITAFPQGTQRYGSEGGLFLALLLLGVSFYLAPKGLADFASSIVDFRQRDVESSAPARKALIQGINIYFILLFIYSKGMLRKIAAVGLAVSFLPLASLGDRSSLVLPFVVWIYAAYRAGRFSTFTLVAGLGVTVTALISLGVVRGYLIQGVWSPMSIADGIGKGLNMIVYDQFLLYLDYSGISATRYGTDFFNGLTSLIPRSLWSGKADFISPGAWLGYAVYGRDNLGFPFTTPGEWFANFGSFGVAVGGYLSGFILRLAENTIRSGQYLFGSIIFFYTMLGGFTTLFVTKMIIIVIVPTAFVLISRRRANRKGQVAVHVAVHRR